VTPSTPSTTPARFFYVTKAAIRNLVRRIDGSGVRRVQMESLSLDFSIEGIDGRTSDFSL
jgi:hypothetical protein